MNPRLSIPCRTHELAINASNDARRLSQALTGTTTPAQLALAEQARNRAMQNLRELGSEIRVLRKGGVA